MGRRLLLTGAVVFALTAGCSSGDAEPGTDGAAADTASLNAAASAYAQLNDVLYRLYDKCMTGKGFTVHPRYAPMDPAVYAVKEVPPDRPENLDDARKYGYRISVNPPTEATGDDDAPDPFDQLPADVRRGYAEGLTGPGAANRSENPMPGEKEREVFVMPDGNKQFVYKKGCQPETDRAVLGDVRRYVELRYFATSGLDRAVWDASANGPEVTAARGEWISCMSGKGYPGMTDTVDAARKAEAYYQNVSQSNPDAVRLARDKETAQAVAHAECADETGINDKLAVAWNRELAAYLAAHEADLLAWQDFCGTALTRAQNMLGS